MPNDTTTAFSATDEYDEIVDVQWSIVRQALKAGLTGTAVEVRGLKGTFDVISITPAPNEIVLTVSDPMPGTLVFSARPLGPQRCAVDIRGEFSGEDSVDFAKLQGRAWTSWLSVISTGFGM